MVLPGLIVKKVGMTRMVDAEGKMTPVTLVQADNQKVTKVLTPERDGYHGVQVGYYVKPEFRLAKPDIQRLRKADIAENYTRFSEFRLEAPSEGLALGTTLTVSGLSEVLLVDVTGVTKGRGFQGAIKRHGSQRGRMSHGSMYHRRTGSLGNRATPARVFKLKKVPGHMGVDNRTIQNLKIMDVDVEKNVIALKGAVPGFRNGYLVLRPSIKKRKAAGSSGAKKEKEG